MQGVGSVSQAKAVKHRAQRQRQVGAEAEGPAARAGHHGRRGRPRPVRSRQKVGRPRREGEETAQEDRRSQEGAAPPPEKAPDRLLWVCR